MLATATRRKAPEQETAPRGNPLAQLAFLAVDPVRFAEGLLLSSLWGVEKLILQSIATRSRTAVKACHASGKTFTAALAVMWWLIRYPNGIVVTTAPTWTQVEKLLWGEVHKAAGRGVIAFPPINKTELPLGPDNYAIGLSTNEGVRFQGWHGRILVVLDEAPGVLAEIWEAVEGIRAGGDVRVLALGNPLIASGPFYDAFTANRKSWSTITISAFDTPNLEGVTLDRLLTMPPRELAIAPRPYLTTRQWVRDKYEELGPAHPFWQAKVLGAFPDQAENALISLAWIERAGPEIPGHDHEKFTAGLDVAGPGDANTVLVIRQGPNRKAIHRWPGADPRGEVVAALRPYKGQLDNVNVDDVGIGYYFKKHLQDEGFPVTGINVGVPAHDSERFYLRKAELYWGLRERFQQADIGGIADSPSIAQLTGIQYDHNPRGQVVMETKDQMRERGVKSPDDAEAHMLAYAPPERVIVRDLDPAHYVTLRR